MSGELLKRTASYEYSRDAWERAGAMAIDPERLAEQRVETANTQIAEANQAHREWCSPMLEEVRIAQAALRQERESLRAEQEVHRTRVEGAAQQAARTT